jgi:type IX secretion system PorP/SprF family membrane protein
MRIFLTGVFLSFFACVTYAQDLHFTQYTSAPMLLNPALTASWKDVELTLQQKQQWQSVKAYSTSGLSFEIKASRFNWEKVDRMTANYKKKLMKGLAFGLYAYSDKAGDASLRTNTIELGIAYHARIDELNAISAGLIGGIIQSSISADKLRWNDQYSTNGYDPTLPSYENIDGSKVRADFGMGALWTYGKVSRTISSNDETNIHAGISIMHVNRPDQSFLYGGDKMHMRLTIHSAAVLKITNTNVAFCPSFLIMKQGKQHEITAGSIFKFEMKESSKITGFKKSTYVLMGAYYRHKDAIAPYFGFEFSAYSLGLSYDVNFSGLKSVTKSMGGVEVMLRVSNPQAFLYQNKTKASFD